MSHGHLLDGIRLARRRPSAATIASWPEGTSIVDTDAGKIRVRDTGGDGPALVMSPDGPCVIEHYETLIAELASHFRVVCFDMPGIGFSYPKIGHDFGLDTGVGVVVAVMDALEIERATLSFSCVNGFVALAAARDLPDRISQLILTQTPSLHDMKNRWVGRNIPRPLRVPFLGQAITAVAGKKMASGWYDTALPKDSRHRGPFTDVAVASLDSGGVFCLASIVQGMRGVTTDELRDIAVPTTLVWGSRDWSHKDTDPEDFRDHVPACDIHIFDNAGHFPDLEQPKAFAALLRSAQ